MNYFDSGRIRELLHDLGSQAEARGLRLELALAGGAALALLVSRQRTTKDIDVLVLPPGNAAIVRELAAAVASAHDLPPDWLNDGMKGFLHGLALGAIAVEAPGIVVRFLAVEQLLAMKLSAWRDDVDIDDAASLLALIAGGREEVWRRVEPFLVPGRELKARYAFDDLWESRP